MSNCIVTGGSSNDAAPMGVLLLNLKETQSWIDHVIIYHDGGISSKDQCVMQSIMPVEFIKYKFPGDTSSFNEIIRYVYTPTIFCKYECLKLLEQFESVVWTDYDVIFLKDVPELTIFNDSSSGLRSLIARDNDVGARFYDQIRGEDVKEMGEICPLDSLSIFTGLMSFSRKLKSASRLYNECITLTSRYGKYLVHPEQAVLDMAVRICSIVPESIPWSYAYSPQWNVEEQKEPKILHAISQPKYWNGLKNSEWDRNYEDWLAMGGSRWHPQQQIWRTFKRKFFFFMNKFLN